MKRNYHWNLKFDILCKSLRIMRWDGSHVSCIQLQHSQWPSFNYIYNLASNGTIWELMYYNRCMYQMGCWWRKNRLSCTRKWVIISKESNGAMLAWVLRSLHIGSPLQFLFDYNRNEQDVLQVRQANLAIRDQKKCFCDFCIVLSLDMDVTTECLESAYLNINQEKYR